MRWSGRSLWRRNICLMRHYWLDAWRADAPPGVTVNYRLQEVQRYGNVRLSDRR
jgi:hypothetical protein